ncbi:hypothetical protein HanRHA438_Chr08g0369601 [Helianthus annuus]|uniref:Uncharacterized protein n=1 Tax=Helianthus annuus TaxID=4232 RepID=A0A251UPX2_HELAN|nr:hypothetical protein HanXRQr2_Chr08g0357491 [Helianthus annuus]KAJ0540171.1 hypothetical protein HanHA300_Chr08g0295171 [Helianthus annuus]KAJ0548632.1 hypothetical protein HanIR_Chr08g0385941 [Helianthus annuus]KAJ0554915.1 hypothetical protein HanHA89_Chr08g0313691 [Helianthus annuus]KAJ0720481.1 hypothetical protein HanLR1_Chr08g0294021 [Helianthus annuus]
MWILLLVTFFNWLTWFPFLLLHMDWMGKDVYGGKVGALGLMVNSVVSGLVSLCVERLARWVGCVKRLWGGMNFLLAVCLAKTLVVTHMAMSEPEFTNATPTSGVVGLAFATFAVLGALLVVIVVSLLSEQWDSLMGGGNMPAFVVGDVVAAFSGIITFTMLHSPPLDVLVKVSGGSGMHPKIMISNKIFGFI